MDVILTSPAKATIIGMPAVVLSVLITLIGLGVLVFIVSKRLIPLNKAASDPRMDNIKQRLINAFMIPHHKMPRYFLASVIHIIVLTGFIIISLRWITLVFTGFSDFFVSPGLGGVIGLFYGMLRDISATLVLCICIFAMVRRIYLPKRYQVPSRYGRDKSNETMLMLFLIAFLMAADMFFEGSLASAQAQYGIYPTKLLIPGTGVWAASKILSHTPIAKLQSVYLGFFYFHQTAFFLFLCLLPFNRFFHLMTSLPNLFSMKLKKGAIKPVKWGVPDDKLEDLESFGVKKFEDFTWKHMLDFYSCADCGRCSDQCPANAVGRPLSPRFISIKAREYMFNKYPVWGEAQNTDEPLIGTIYSEDEIWSCTTCGACEQECPLMIEYIDKIVDLRRGMVDEGMVPQSIQKPLSALEKRGNPWGKMEKKRADWTKVLEKENGIKVNMIEKGDPADTLYFVDSITSFDDRMQDIARATAKILTAAGINFGILGSLEKDSGNEVRRFGEEMLFQNLKSINTEEIKNSEVKNIVTADPHAFNALKNEYAGIPPVEHISQTIVKSIKAGKIRLTGAEDTNKVYTYHDPCYLGRHNDVYEDPRAAIDAIPGIKRVDMEKCRDRSFCCSGGGLMLFYEPEEEQRMSVLRVEMAKQAGANVIITACPFCLVNIEDAIKVCGMEGKMEAIDLAELVAKHLG